MVQPARRALFLRGINVGTAKRIAMRDLARLVEGLGATEVRTLLNSGNVVCTSAASPEGLASSLSSAIAGELGHHVDVVARTSDQIDAVLAADPWRALATDPSRYLVVFLDRTPEPDRLTALEAIDVAPERWIVRDRELYAWLPPGVADSVLVKQLAKGALGVTWTGRNWTTVSRVRDLL